MLEMVNENTFTAETQRSLRGAEISENYVDGLFLASSMTAWGTGRRSQTKPSLERNFRM